MAVAHRLPDQRTNTSADPIEHLERRIAATRMTAALDTDWQQLHLRSRALIKQFTQAPDPSRQIATARQIRTTLLQSGDTPGLRALRLATAGPMAGWLQNRSARPAARSFERQLAADQRAAIPGLARLEDELARARRRAGQRFSGVCLTRRKGD